MFKKKPQIQVIISQGLGNQMFQYAMGRRLARHSNCELILAPYADGPNGSHAIYRLRHFNIVGRDVAFHELDTEDAPRYQRALNKLLPRIMSSPLSIKPIYEKHVFDFVPELQTCSLTETDRLLFEPELLCPQRNVRLFGYWQNETYFADIADIIRAEFNIKAELDSQSQACLQMIQNGPSVFLHVRRGDYLEDAHARSIGVRPAEYYHAGLDLLYQLHGNNLRSFVFSNDFGWVKENNIGGDSAILVDWNDQTPQNDLMLMRACQHAVIANSSFSWWGAWLGEWPGQTVIAPEIWYKSVPQYRDIVPERWIRI